MPHSSRASWLHNRKVSKQILAFWHFPWRLRNFLNRSLSQTPLQLPGATNQCPSSPDGKKENIVVPSFWPKPFPLPLLPFPPTFSAPFLLDELHGALGLGLCSVCRMKIFRRMSWSALYWYSERCCCCCWEGCDWGRWGCLDRWGDGDDGVDGEVLADAEDWV